MATPSPATTVTVTIPASTANDICLSQTPGAAGNLTLNGASVTAGVAILATVGTAIQCQVGITTAASETGKSVVITGTKAGGQTISETVALPASATTVSSVGHFQTVTQIAISAAAAAALTVGRTGIGCQVTGTVNYTVQYTYDDIQQAPSLINWYPLSSITAKTANQDGPITSPCNGVRLLMNSGTGTVVMEILQSRTSV